MLVGYRGWQIKTIGGRAMLVSPTHHQVWQPGENTARCVSCQDTLDENCSCGFYALKQVRLTLGAYGSDIIGQVFLYGTIVEAEEGYRAKKAQISLLLIPSIRAVDVACLEALSRLYNVALIKAVGDDYLWLCARRNNGLRDAGHFNLSVNQRIRLESDRKRFSREDFIPNTRITMQRGGEIKVWGGC